MVSDLGKILDPIADKLTQAAMLLCLLISFPLMLFPLLLMACKELFMAVTGTLIIRKTGMVPGAAWHGKAATVLLYTCLLYTSSVWIYEDDQNGGYYIASTEKVWRFRTLFGRSYFTSGRDIRCV